jgi:hypothetical protein
MARSGKRARRPHPKPTAGPEAWLAALPPARAAELSRVREVVRNHLPAGYREAVRGNVIAYEVPLERYPDTYNGQPLWYAALGAPKSYLTLHLMSAYASPEIHRRLADGFRAAGKKLDMGKACIRYRKADDLALDVIGDLVGSLPVDRWVAIAGAARRR